MSESPIRLRGKSGGVVFEGTQSPGGGSQPFKLLRVPITFATPALVPFTLYTPTLGDTIDFDRSWITIPTAFNGTNPTLNFTASDLASEFASFSLGTADPATTDWLVRAALEMNGATSISGPVWVDGSTLPFLAVIDDGNGGDPGSTAGEFEIVWVITPAAP